eukprot:tig00020572_g11589.t1
MRRAENLKNKGRSAAPSTANRGRLAERRVLLRYGFLLRGYRRRRFFWEAVVVLRKLAFVFVASFFSSRPVVQGLLGTGILVAGAPSSSDSKRADPSAAKSIY